MNNNTNLNNVKIGKNILISVPQCAIMDKIKAYPIFAFSEKNRTYRAKNLNKKIGCKLQIDGQLYLDDTKKCDYGLLLEDGRFFLIELKGGDVNFACKQLLTTLKLLKKDYINHKFKFFCRIVAKQGLPKISSNKQMLIKEIGEANNIYNKSMFKSRENILEEDI